MSRRDFTERDIHMALDGELSEDERPGFEAWLEANPEMKAKSIRFEDDRARLKNALAGVLDEPAPGRLTRRVMGEGAPSSAGWGRWRMAAAAVLLLALGLGGGYFAGHGGLGMEASAEDKLSEDAIAVHMLYASEQRHAVEVGAGEKDHLLTWLSDRLGVTLVAPDLSADGFHLVGGRLLPAGPRSAAMLLYENAEGGRISIYVTTEGAEKSWGIYEAEHGGASAIYWLDKGWGCAVVGTLPEEQLIDVGKKAYRQMLAGAGLT
jgi:anti-sigma factor RsiW